MEVKDIKKIFIGNHPCFGIKLEQAGFTNEAGQLRLKQRSGKQD